MPSSGDEAPLESAAESLRALRRGLQFAEGFALYIAVCNSPVTVRSLIDILQESMPGVEIEAVELDDSVEDPLARVLEISTPARLGPLMIVGLERSCPSDAPDHPVLHVLNLQRPEWPKRIPRPVVLWIPEYLLSLMGTEAPDFLDWRSDTLFFPSESVDLQVLTSAAWVEGLDGRMPEQQRRARIEELRARLRSTGSATDRVVLSARSSWLNEMGNHLFVLGDAAGAETAYAAALDIETRLGRRRGMIVTNGNLGAVAAYRENLEQAEQWFERSLSLAREVDDLPGIASALGNLGLNALRRQDLPRAKEWTIQAMDLFQEQGNDRDLTIACGNLAHIYLRQGRLDEAVPLALKAIELSEKIGDRLATAGNYRLWAGVLGLRGDYTQAEEVIGKALSISEELGHQVGIATDLALLGDIYREQGKVAAAKESAARARSIYRALDMDSLVKTLDHFLASLPPVNT